MVLNYDKSFKVYGVDISKYAIKKAHPEVKKNIYYSNCKKLKWKKNLNSLAL